MVGGVNSQYSQNKSKPVKTTSMQLLSWRPLNHQCGLDICLNALFAFVIIAPGKLIKELIDCFVVLLINSIWRTTPWRYSKSY